MVASDTFCTYLGLGYQLIFRTVHLDDQNYDWPYQFNPWRWQDKNISSCNFPPFGGGQRLCPGLDLARLEASIFLHHFVTQFRLSWQNQLVAQGESNLLLAWMKTKIVRIVLLLS